MIESLQDLHKDLHIRKDIIERIETRILAATGSESVTLTELQRTAFNTPHFWYSDYSTGAPPRHIIIQGATSAGKTLVSEMAIAESLEMEKNAIVLVPLKAMVRERRDHIARDFSDARVYASSGDFLDHDAEIIDGKFEVAVIVYEKFFAMLSQQGARILDNCALLVVDELQMLGADGRGPKLEFSIQKVMGHNQRQTRCYTRIMCLATCDCKVEYVEEWLGSPENPVLKIPCDTRPIGLEEYVISTDGKMVGKYTPGERDSEYISTGCESPEPLSIENFNPSARETEAKKLLLIELLRKIHADNPKAKILVFVATRRDSAAIAEYIYNHNIFESTELSSEMLGALENYDSDDAQTALTKLLTQRIAFHNSSLSVALRDFIETVFQGSTSTTLGIEVPEDSINVVVATETLTVGMNMPVDVMILFDSSVPRGGGSRVPLTPQEYKNYIGRAGRLGQTNRVGKSYLFVYHNDTPHNRKDPIARVVEKYVDCKKENIMSAMMNADYEQQAPYYLSLLDPSLRYEKSEISNMEKESFSHHCNGQPVNTDDMLDALKTYRLVKLSAIPFSAPASDPKYQLSDLGGYLAPYALCLNTSNVLYSCFVEGNQKGIPTDISAEQIDGDEFLLDILYVLCLTKEISELSQLRLPSESDPSKNRERCKEIYREFCRIARGNSGAEGVHLWPNSLLSGFLDDVGNLETDDYQRLMRAILLWHWTKGHTIDEIRKATGFNIPLFSGDLSRMAEVAGFELDAVYKCTAKNGSVNYDAEGIHALYRLSTRVTYGMPRSLVIIANRQIFGLDRKRILGIEPVAKRHGFDSPALFLANASQEQLEEARITEKERSAFITSIDRIYLMDDFEKLLDKIQRYPTGSASLSNNEVAAIKSIYGARETDISADSILDCLEKLLTSNQFFKDISFIHDGNTIMLNDKRTMKNIHVGVFSGTASNRDKLKRNFAMYKYERTLLLFYEQDSAMLDQLSKKSGSDSWQLCTDDGGVILDNINTAMTLSTFAGLLTQAAAHDDQDMTLLFSFLFDCSGAFWASGCQELYGLLKNYLPTSGFGSAVNTGRGVYSQDLRILCDFRRSLNSIYLIDLFDGLKKNGISFRVLPWGSLDAERDSDGCTLLCITSRSLRDSSNVEHFFETRRQRQFRNTFALFENESQFAGLSGDTNYPFSQLVKQVSANPAVMISFVREQLAIANYESADPSTAAGDSGVVPFIGVSYSHTPEHETERPALTWFRKIILQLNAQFGESNVLFDENGTYRSCFSGSGAVDRTLALYRRCRFYIVLDDSHYTDGDNCPKECDTIREEIDGSNLKRAWFITPKNGTGTIARNTDYHDVLEYSSDSVENNAANIIRAIEELTRNSPKE